MIEDIKEESLIGDLGYANKKFAQKFMTQISNADYDTDT